MSLGGCSILIALSFQIFGIVSQSYGPRCPSGMEWNIKAKFLCKDKDKYYCLYNNVIGNYVEGCEGPDWDRKGSKRIYSGYFTRGVCKSNRYQPFKFWTNETYDCVYEKSFCKERGQIIFSNGSNETNSICSCDHSNGYAFINPPVNIYYCNPETAEDCSCFSKKCLYGFTLSRDYKCIVNTTTGIDGQTTIGLNITDIRNSSAYLSFSVNRTNARHAVYMIIGSIILVVICSVLIRRCIIARSISLSKEKAEEEINFLKIIYIFYCIATPIIRIKFEREIPPKQLYTRIKNNHKRIFQLVSLKIINKRQQHLIFTGKVTSKDLDLRLMVELLKILPDTQITKSSLNSLVLLDNIFKLTTDSYDSLIPDDEFNIQWDDISKAILSLAGMELQDRPLRENKLLSGLLWELHPLELANRQLYYLLQLHQQCSTKILKKIMCQYFKDHNLTFMGLLENNKHDLFHKRSKTHKCCQCERKKKLSTFTKVIPEVLWSKLFQEKTSEHKGCTSGLCAECFLAKEGIDLLVCERDVFLACLLILHIPDILKYVVRCLSKNNLANFLNTSECKKGLKYELEKSQDKTVFCASDWTQLYTSCCVRVKARHSLDLDLVDSQLLIKIFSTVGPISFIQSCMTDIFEHFLKGLANVEYLSSMCQKLTNTNNALLKVIKDKTFKTDMREQMVLLQNEDIDVGIVENEIKKWIADNYNTTQEEEKHNLISVLAKCSDDIYDFTWQHETEIQLLGNRKVLNVPEEQNNFLKIVYLVFFVARPVVKIVFDRFHEDERKTYGNALADQTLTKCHGKRKVEEFNIIAKFLSKCQHKKTFHLTDEDYSVLMSMKKTTSSQLSLKLLIYILKVLKYQRKRNLNESHGNNEEEEEIVSIEMSPDIQNEEKAINMIDHYRHMATQSRDGKLPVKTYEQIRTNIKGALQTLGGKENVDKTSWLDSERNILEFLSNCGKPDQ